MKKDSGLVKKEVLAVMPDLRRFAISVAGNVADGDDLLQSTVERVLSKGVPFDADMKKWVFRVCKNLWIDQYRAAQTRNRAVADIRMEYNESLDGEQTAHSKMILKNALNLISSLPEDQRMVMTLIAIDGYSYKDAADILDTPIGTIMSRLSRARKSLSAQMNPQVRAD